MSKVGRNSVCSGLKVMARQSARRGRPDSTKKKKKQVDAGRGKAGGDSIISPVDKKAAEPTTGSEYQVRERTTVAKPITRTRLI